MLGQAKESDEALRELVEKHGEDSAFQVAQVHAVRGEADAAFEWLERAFEQKDSGLFRLKFSVGFSNLHGDSRWPVFVRKSGFEADR